MDQTHDSLPERHQRAIKVEPAAAAIDARWPGGVMVLLILVGIGWPLVTLGAAVPTFLIADCEQAVVLAGVGGLFMLLHWALGA